jgi:hypothetical protein
MTVQGFINLGVIVDGPVRIPPFFHFSNDGRRDLSVLIHDIFTSLKEGYIIMDFYPHILGWKTPVKK